ncbi:MAG: acylphosphatase [Chloroflexi bacterium]|nr:acylphosphatase [Chloroflexota bacterium]
MKLASVQVIISGHVQGVNFRAFTTSQAKALGLTGYVRNLSNRKEIEVRAEGERKTLESLISQIRTGPPAARVEKVDTSWSEYTGSYTDFRIKY